MSFFNFGAKEVSVLPGTSEQFNFFSFMEIGDLIYYTPPGSGKTVTATVVDFTIDDQGRPKHIYLKLADGSVTETTISRIRY